MAFAHRLATLAAVVAIPLGIAATSYVLTDAPKAPKVPPKVELSTAPAGGTPSSPAPPAPSSTRTPAPPTPAPAPTPTRKAPTPSDAVVPGPPATDDEDDDLGDDG
ncbi:small hydrophilic protein [Streptomyces sp. NPDC000410]|uniref:small hydrophilic protein n=1 Tax=Streptomyces sp. NPDC000410 TaxID=3154254 RepID=UPI00332EC3E8